MAHSSGVSVEASSKSRPPRCAVVHCPGWPLVAAIADRIGSSDSLAPDQPLVIFRSQRVSHCSPAAWRAGVRLGQRRRQAQGACPDLVIVAHDPERDARWFEPVVREIGELVPLIDVETPGSLLLATRGPSRYVGGDAALAIKLAQLAEQGIRGVVGIDDVPAILSAGGGFGIGIADGRVTATLAARSAARHGQPIVVEAGSESTALFLSSHPVRVLSAVAGCPPELVELLERLGLRRLGDVAALTPAHLVDRFGNLGLTLYELVTGTDDTAPNAAPPPSDLSMRRFFDDPIQQFDQLMFAAKSLVDQLSTYFYERGLVCTRLEVEGETEHGETSRRVWYRAEGLDALAMLDRLRWQLDGWINGPYPPSAGVTSLRLDPVQIRQSAGTQQAFWGGRSQADDDATRAMTRVIGLLGPQSVLVASWRGGRDPQQMFELVPFADLGADDRRVVSVPASDQESPPWPGSLPAPAPAWIDGDSEPIEVLDGQGRAVMVNGRGLVSAEPVRLVRRSQHFTVVAWAGPWPVHERWWDTRARRVARFQLVVETPDGQRAFLTEIASGTWKLTAEYA